MTARTGWRHWRREVHDIIEVGGDAHPAGRLVNAIIILLIFLMRGLRAGCAVARAFNAPPSRDFGPLANARGLAGQGAQSEGRTRKARVPSPRRSKRSEPETL